MPFSRPSWIFLVQLMIIMPGLIFVLANDTFGTGIDIMFLTLISVLLWIVTSPLKWRISSECKTMGGLCMRIFRWNFNELYQPETGPQKIFSLMRTLLALQTHQKESAISRETTTDDLNAVWG